MEKSILDVTRTTHAWTQVLFFTLLFSHLAWLPYAHAGPEGGTVTGGSGSINHSGNQTTIHQDTQNMAIDWNSYNVDVNERVQYIQPNSTSISLNRILSNAPSEIRGRIDANGQIILVNPNGVFFTPTSVINVGSMIASGLDIKVSDFMNGQYIFRDVEGTDGQVVNDGIIRASTGGNVTLLGKLVRNDGMIVAKLGTVNLVAGKEAVLTFDNNGLIGIGITKAILQDELGLDPALLNNGEIKAEGGKVLLTASVSRDIFSQVLDIDKVQATSVVVHDDGTFTLGGGADVVNSGSIDVSTSSDLASDPNVARIVLVGENVTSSGSLKADNANGGGGEIELHARDTTLLTNNSITSARSGAHGKGGIVKVLGNKVGLFDQSMVDVSGAEGGGTALVGGDQQGQNTQIRNAEFIFLGENTQVKADALDQGDGGKIITFAEDTARIYGGLYARGGMHGGDGGFIETSGRQGFEILKMPDISAVAGAGGEWLIDPNNISIVSGNGSPNIDNAPPNFSSMSEVDAELGVDLIKKALTGGATVTITTSIPSNSANTTDGNIIFWTDLDYDGTGNSTIILKAANSIITNGNNIYDKNINKGTDRLNIFLHADNDTNGSGDVLISDSRIYTNGGNFTATGANFTSERTNPPDYILTNGGTVTLDMTGNINIGAEINTGGSQFSATSTGSFTNDNANGSINTGSGKIIIESTNSGVTLGELSTTGDLTLTAGNGTITQSEISSRVLNIAGETALDSTSNIILANANQFNTVNILSAMDVNLTDSDGAIALSGKVGNNLTVRATGHVANGNVITNPSELSVGGATNITVNDGESINLEHTGNDFTGGVTLNAATGNIKNIKLYDNSALTLQPVLNITGNLTVRGERLTLGTTTVGGNLNAHGGMGSIRQTGVINVTGTSQFETGGIENITLFQANNFTGAVSLYTASSDVFIKNNKALTLGKSNVNGDLVADVIAGELNQLADAANGVTVTELTTIQLADGENIVLGNIKNQFTTLTATASGLGQLASVTISNDTALDLQDIDLSGNLTLTTNNANITDSGNIIVDGLTTLNAGSGTIALDATSNNLTDLTVNTTDTAYVYDVDTINLVGTSTVGNLTLEAVQNITDAADGRIDASGVVQLVSGADIILDSSQHTINTLRLSSSGDSTVTTASNVDMGLSTVGGDLTINSGGNISNNAGALDITGTAHFSVVNDGSIHLTDTGNHFAQPVFLSASSGNLKNVTLTNTVATQVNVTNQITDNLDITSGGKITSGTALRIGGVTTLSANGQDITLVHADNNFNILNVDAANKVNIVDANSIALGLVKANQTTLTVGGQITDHNGDAMNIIGNKATLEASTGVGAGDALETQLAHLNITNLNIINDAGKIGIHNTGDVTVNMHTSGDIDFTNVGDVHIDLLDSIANGYTHSLMELTVVNGSVFSAVPDTRPDIRGHDVTVIVNDGEGDFGEAGRPIYLDVHGVFTLLANVSSYDFYDAVPSDIIDN